MLKRQKSNTFKVFIMSYFPLSSDILTIYSDIRQSISRQKFFGEWSVSDSDSNSDTKSDYSEISELYY